MECDTLLEIKYDTLLEKQKKLDDDIIANVFKQKFVTTADHRAFLTQRILALMVEVAETDDTTTREERLEESIDVLHFILSVQHTLELRVVNGMNTVRDILNFIPDIVVKFPVNRLMLNLYKCIARLANSTRCFKYWSQKESDPKQKLELLMLDVLTGWLCLMKKYGYTAEEIEQAYLKKNNINHQRQKEGY